MKKSFIILILFSVALTACEDSHEKQSQLFGDYAETYPIQGRSNLIFISGNIVVKTENEGNIRDTFRYEIIDNQIKLIPIIDNSLVQTFEFKIISEFKFKIENLFPSILENSISYITYEKK